MSEHVHKRRHSSQDVDLDVDRTEEIVTTVLDRIQTIKEQLCGFMEKNMKRDLQMQSVSDELRQLIRNMESKIKPESPISKEKLKKAGIMRGFLKFDHAKVTQLAQAKLTADAEIKIVDLYTTLKKIWAHVNMDHNVGSVMILEAILLALADITSDKHRAVTILPEMRIAQADAVSITHPISGYILWLNKSVDYAIVEYEDVMDDKKRLITHVEAIEDIQNIIKNYLLIAEAENQGDITLYIPDAVRQAIALLKTLSLPEVRFCLSNGQTWIFLILKLENETPIFYESTICSLSKENLENSDMALREVMQLLIEWLRPKTADLYKLVE